MSDSLRPQGLQPTRPLRPWDVPGRSTGVGCHHQLLLLLSRFSRVRLCATQRWQPTRLFCPWDSPGKNTGVGCHFLLQSMRVKSESEVAQSCLTLYDPMDCSPPGSSIHGIFQARVLEWGTTLLYSKYFNKKYLITLNSLISPNYLLFNSFPKAITN